MIAFFDVDETLIRPKSMLSFLSFLEGESLLPAGTADAFRRRTYPTREQANKGFYELFSGLSVDDVMASGERWYGAVRAELGSGFFVEKTLAALRAHQAAGRTVALVSGSCAACLTPLSREIGPCRLLGAPLEERDGRYTGRLTAPPTIGPGKAQAARALAAETNAELADCFAYGDHDSDLPLLELVGHPTVVAGIKTMELAAEARGWPLFR